MHQRRIAEVTAWLQMYRIAAYQHRSLLIDDVDGMPGDLVRDHRFPEGLQGNQRREHSAVDRHHRLLHPQRLGQGTDMQAAGAAEAGEGHIARVDAALY